MRDTAEWIEAVVDASLRLIEACEARDGHGPDNPGCPVCEAITALLDALEVE